MNDLSIGDYEYPQGTGTTYSPQWGGLGSYMPTSAEESTLEKLLRQGRELQAALDEQRRQEERRRARKYYIVVTQTGEERYTLMLEQLYNREVIAGNLSLEEARELLIARQVADKLQGEQPKPQLTNAALNSVWSRISYP